MHGIQVFTEQKILSATYSVVTERPFSWDQSSQRMKMSIYSHPTAILGIHGVIPHSSICLHGLQKDDITLYFPNK
jgi:hypothetical protein